MAKPTKHYGRWRIRWTDETGKRCSEVHDDFKVATHALRQHEVEAEERRRGVRPVPAAPKTFAEAADYWERNRAPLKRSQKDDLSILKHLRPAFGEMSLASAPPWLPAIDRYLASHAGRLSPKTVANHLTLLGTILRAAAELEWMPRVPRIRKPKVRLISRDFSYLRSEEEVRRFLAAAAAESEAANVLYTTAVYTGLRAGELAGLLWADVDLEARLITVQRSFEGPTKADDVRYAPVLDPLLPVLRAWRLRHPGRLVFTNRDGGMLAPSGRIFQEVFHRALIAAGFTKVDSLGRTRAAIRFHDLRHTFASHWVKAGGDLFKLQKILGHKTVQMTMRYAHLQPTAFLEDLGRLGPAREAAPVAVLVPRTA
jgi:integrase